MDLQTLTIVIGAVIIVLLLIKLALGVAKAFAKIALIVMVILVTMMILMKAGVIPDLSDKSVKDIKDMAKDKIENITESGSDATAPESNATPAEEDSLYPPDYIEQEDQDSAVLE